MVHVASFMPIGVSSCVGRDRQVYFSDNLFYLLLWLGESEVE